MNTRAAIISKALILVLFASLAPTCTEPHSNAIRVKPKHANMALTTRLSISATIPSIAVATANPRVALLSRATTNAMQPNHTSPVTLYL
ncbi:hypothetical protein PSHT_14136 [Puccinia striiformis]|uniref:Uncharacterized protein n=1 Tax=Puccinia striiformis TaxID=27350 RepID=A0A2S4ULQ2_9BASI|nr:hypothetical protein PSHT_14136 [Puccinia striiformis]